MIAQAPYTILTGTDAIGYRRSVSGDIVITTADKFITLAVLFGGHPDLNATAALFALSPELLECLEIILNDFVGSGLAQDETVKRARELIRIINGTPK